MSSEFFAALALGFASSLHCIGMCGGVHGLIAVGRSRNASGLDQEQPTASAYSVVNASSAGSPDLIASSAEKSIPIPVSSTDWLRLPVFALGRISSYALAGFALGAVSFSVQQRFPDMFSWMRLLSGVLLVLLALFIGRWWAGVSVVEKFANALWQPLVSSFNSVSQRKSLGAIFVLGSVWGWIPCGAVYTTLAWAALAADPVKSGLLMFSFGLGTVPALLIAGYSVGALQDFMRKPLLRTFFASALLAYGLWILMSSYSAIAADGSHTHMHESHPGDPVVETCH